MRKRDIFKFNGGRICLNTSPQYLYWSFQAYSGVARGKRCTKWHSHTCLNCVSLPRMSLTGDTRQTILCRATLLYDRNVTSRVHLAYPYRSDTANLNKCVCIIIIVTSPIQCREKVIRKFLLGSVLIHKTLFITIPLSTFLLASIKGANGRGNKM